MSMLDLFYLIPKFNAFFNVTVTAKLNLHPHANRVSYRPTQWVPQQGMTLVCSPPCCHELSRALSRNERDSLIPLNWVLEEYVKSIHLAKYSFNLPATANTPAAGNTCTS
jgi:hypothetical protein